MNEKILIVDDEFTIREVCARVLEKHGYKTAQAEDGLEALEKIEKQPFDIIITDINMPRMDGFGLIKQLKSRNSNTPVIVITGFTDVETAVNAMKAGAYDYITKPFNLEDLLLKTNKCMGHRLAGLESNLFKRIAAMNETVLSIVRSSKNEDEILRVILEKSLEFSGSVSGLILIYDNEENRIKSCISNNTGENTREFLDLSKQAADKAIRENRVVIFNGGPGNNLDLKKSAPLPGPCSFACIPMAFKDKLSGAICLNRGSGNPGGFSDMEIRTLEILASQAASVLIGFRNYSELVETDRLKSEFLGIVSHELRTPLMAIGGAVEMLEVPSTEEQNTLRSIVSRNLERMDKLVCELLDFARMESGKQKFHFADGSVSDIARDLSADFREKFNKKNIKFITKIQDTPLLKIDSERISQVISNLLSNSGKYTKSGGEITLSLEDKTTEITLTVKDNGVGIPEDKQARIFDKFYQVENSLTRKEGGFGLGLSIVKSIIEAHKGRVWLESGLNKGTAFHVTLPVNK